MPESSRDEIAKLEALYAKNPEGRVFTHLAEAYRKAGELDRARAILEAGILKHAGYASAHVVLGRVLMGLDETDAAIATFRTVLGLDPHNLIALRSLGDISRAAGRHQEAVQYFEELRHQDPNNDEIGDIIAELKAAPAAPTFTPVEDDQDDQDDQDAAPAIDEEAVVGEETVSAADDLLAEAPESTYSAESVYGEIELEDRSAGLEPGPSTEPTPEVEPEPEPEPEPPIEPPEQPPVPDFVSQDIDLDWVPAMDEEGLPGDLGELFSAAPPAMSEPEVPTFALPDMDDFSSLNGAGEEPPPEAGSIFEDVSLDVFTGAAPEPEPEFEGEIDMGVAWDDAIPDTVPGFAADSPQDDVDIPEFAPEITPEVADVIDFADTDIPGVPDITDVPDLEDMPEDAPWMPEADAFEAPGAEDIPAFEAPDFDIPEFEIETSPDASGELFTEAFEDPFAEPTTIDDAAAPVDSEESSELVTETIAELYRSQGLNDRAADVYRTLLRERPGDADLEAKLYEAESLARGEVPQHEATTKGEAPSFDDIAPEALEPELPDPAEAWLAGRAGTAESAPTPYAWSEQVQDGSADPEPPIRTYFESLLAWRPTPPPPVPFTPEPHPIDLPREESDPEPVFEDSAPYGQSESDDIVFSDTPPPAEDEDILMLLDELDPPAPEPAVVPPLTAATVTMPDAMPWDEPAPSESPTSPQATTPAPAAPPAPPVIPAAPAPPTAPAAPAPPTAPAAPSNATNSEEAFDEWFGTPEPEPERVAAEDTPPDLGDGEGEDDDDLEMFRSWLQSLKK